MSIQHAACFLAGFRDAYIQKIAEGTDQTVPEVEPIDRPGGPNDPSIKSYDDAKALNLTGKPEASATQIGSSGLLSPSSSMSSAAKNLTPAAPGRPSSTSKPKSGSAWGTVFKNSDRRFLGGSL